jgi:hypothetical protein
MAEVHNLTDALNDGSTKYQWPAPPEPASASPSPPRACVPPDYANRRDAYTYAPGPIARHRVSTGDSPGEGNRRASRNGRVSDPPPEIPNVAIHNLCIAVRGAP